MSSKSKVEISNFNSFHFRINFGLTLTAGYTSQDAVIAKFTMEEENSFIEFGMDRESGNFYYDSTWEKRKLLKIRQESLVADTTILVSIIRDQEVDQSVQITITTEVETHKTEIAAARRSQTEGKMRVEFGGEITDSGAVSRGFHGCIEGAYIDTYKPSAKLPPHRDVFANFKCQAKTDSCIGNVRFNSCHKNQAHRLIQSHRVVEMKTERVNKQPQPPRGKLRVKPPKCPAYPKPEVKSEGFEFNDGQGVVRFDTKQLRGALKDDFELAFQVNFVQAKFVLMPSFSFSFGLMAACFI